MSDIEKLMRDMESEINRLRSYLEKAKEALKLIASHRDDPNCFCGSCVAARRASRTLKEIDNGEREA